MSRARPKRTGPGGQLPTRAAIQSWRTEVRMHYSITATSHLGVPLVEPWLAYYWGPPAGWERKKKGKTKEKSANRCSLFGSCVYAPSEPFSGLCMLRFNVSMSHCHSSAWSPFKPPSTKCCDVMPFVCPCNSITFQQATGSETVALPAIRISHPSSFFLGLLARLLGRGKRRRRSEGPSSTRLLRADQGVT